MCSNELFHGVHKIDDVNFIMTLKYTKNEYIMRNTKYFTLRSVCKYIYIYTM